MPTMVSCSWSVCLESNAHVVDCGLKIIVWGRYSSEMGLKIQCEKILCSKNKCIKSNNANIRNGVVNCTPHKEAHSAVSYQKMFGNIRNYKCSRLHMYTMCCLNWNMHPCPLTLMNVALVNSKWQKADFSLFRSLLRGTMELRGKDSLDMRVSRCPFPLISSLLLVVWLSSSSASSSELPPFKKGYRSQSSASVPLPLSNTAL